MQQNQYGDYRDDYSYGEQNRDSYRDEGFAGRRENAAYPKQEFGSYQDHNQSKSKPNASATPQSNYSNQFGGNNFGSQSRAQGQYDQQWNAGRENPSAESWERKDPLLQKKPAHSAQPAMYRERENPMFQQKDRSEARQVEGQWGGQNQYHQEPTGQRFSNTRPPQPFEDRRPTALLPTPLDNSRQSELSSSDRRPPRGDQGMSPVGGERSYRSEPRADRRDNGPPRRGDRDEPGSRRGERDDSHSRRVRDVSRRGDKDDAPSRRDDRNDSLPRRSDRDDSSSRRSTRDPPSRRNDRDESRSRPSDRRDGSDRDRSSGGRDGSRSTRDHRDDRDKSRDESRRSDTRSSKEDLDRDRGRRDRRPPTRDERRPREERGRSNDRQDKASSTRILDDTKPSKSALIHSEPQSKPQTATQKKGLLPLPDQAATPSPSDKAGLSTPTPRTDSKYQSISFFPLPRMPYEPAAT